MTILDSASEPFGFAAPDSSPSPAPPRTRRAASGRAVLSALAANPLAAVCLAILVLVVLFCWIGPLLYHTDQVHTQLQQIHESPSGQHLLGTDAVGHDVLGRLMLGGQSSLAIGFAAAALASIVGTLWGALAGYFGGWLDAILMRVVDTLLAIPALLLLLVLVTVTTPSIPSLILVTALVSWLPTARQVRSQALTLRTREYVAAARCAGARSQWIILRHIVPDVMGVVAVQTTFEVSNAILLLATLSFLGLGPAPPATNWGAMLSDGLNYVYDGYWWLVYPAGVMIVGTVLVVNYLGDNLRDALDVRLRDH